MPRVIKGFLGLLRLPKNLENALLVPRWCFPMFWTHQSWFCASLQGLYGHHLIMICGFLELAIILAPRVSTSFLLGLLPSLLDLLVYLGGSQGSCMG